MQGEDEHPAKRRRSNTEVWIDDCIAADEDEVARIAKLRNVTQHKRNTASTTIFFRYAEFALIACKITLRRPVVQIFVNVEILTYLRSCRCSNHGRYINCHYRLKCVPTVGGQYVIYQDKDYPEHDHSVERFSRGLAQKYKDGLAAILAADPHIKPKAAVMQVFQPSHAKHLRAFLFNSIVHQFPMNINHSPPQLAINMPDFIGNKDNKQKADHYLQNNRSKVCSLPPCPFVPLLLR
jgi:hypothetical protein